MGLPTKSSITVICRSCGWRQHAFREYLNGISREKIQFDVFVHWFIAGLVSDWAFEVVAFKEVTADWKSDEMSSTRHGSRSVWLSDLSNWMVYWQERVQIKTIKFIVNSIYTMIICHLHALRDERVLEWITHLSFAKPPWFRSSGHGRWGWSAVLMIKPRGFHFRAAPASRPRRVWRRANGKLCKVFELASCVQLEAGVNTKPHGE